MQKFEDMADEGILGALYTLNGWFVKIKPATAIYKVKFSFVQKGTSGSNSFDIYMPVQKFHLLCEDIKSYRFLSKCKMDHEKQASSGKYFPSAFTFNTGDNGIKTLNIGASKNGGILINGSPDKKTWANVPTDYDSLREIAFWWDCYTKASHWTETAGNLILKGVRKSESFHQEPQSAVDEPTENINSTSLPVNTEPTYNVAIKTTGKLEAQDGRSVIPVTDGKRNFNLIIKKSDENKFGQNWSTLAQYSDKGITLNIKVLCHKDALVFVDILKSAS